MTTKFFSSLLAIVVTMSLSVMSANAKPLRKPSNGEIKKIIKKMLLKTKTPIFAGIYPSDQSTKCENIHIKRIKLLKVGRASSNYYERSGSYISSNFMVKFSISGSCTLNSPYRINKYEYDRYTNSSRRDKRKSKPVMPMDLKGRVPFKNIPFEIEIYTDDYGDWYSNSAWAFNKRDRTYSKNATKYLKNLFYKTQHASVKKWKKEQTIAASKLSYSAETGLKVIKYDRLYTKELAAKLRVQPKRIREAIFSQYWKLSSDRAKQIEFIRVVSEQLRNQR